MKIVLLVVIVFMLGGYYITKNLKFDETIVSARYEMLACENCNHMTVEKSQDSTLVNKSIIPISDNVDIDELIERVVDTKETLCLRGRPYRFNFNVLGIKPDGVRFDVAAMEKPEVCDF